MYQLALKILIQSSFRAGGQKTNNTNENGIILQSCQFIFDVFNNIVQENEGLRGLFVKLFHKMFSVQSK